MKTSADGLDNLTARIERLRAEHDRHYPGAAGGRQPIHTVYVPADRFTETTPADFGAEALRLIREHGLDAFGIADDIAGAVRERVRAKLTAEPVEDVRIDFEDGYGVRAGEEEDEHVLAAARAVARAHESGALPAFWGLRVKSFADGLHKRSMRTLDGFLTEVTSRAGVLPPGFTVTFPKVVMPGHVAAFAEYCGRLEDVLGLSEGTLRFEVQIETTESIVDHDGGVALRAILDASAGRMCGAHFGVFDYTAACGLPPAEQRLDHPACDFARHIMQVTLAETGVRLSDGSTNVTPASDATPDVHKAWRIHATHVRHSLRHGFYQGWDLHPSHLPSRYAVVYDFHLNGMDDVLSRLRAWKERTGDDTGVLDEPATVKALTARVRRAVDCGAIDEAALA